MPITKKSEIARAQDPRALRSRDALREAFLRLIAEQRFEDISIRDLTTAAGVSYPVFFRQFARKEELLEDIAAAEIRGLLGYASTAFGPKGAPSIFLCRYVDEHRTLWTALLTAGAAQAMRQEFIRIAREMARTRKRENPQLPVELASNLVVSGMFEILSWWLAQPKSYPIENVAKMIDALVLTPIRQPIKLKRAVGRSD